MRSARDLPSFPQQDVVGDQGAQHVKAGDRDGRLDLPVAMRQHFGDPGRLALLVLSGGNFQVVEKAACHRLHIVRCGLRETSGSTDAARSLGWQGRHNGETCHDHLR